MNTHKKLANPFVIGRYCGSDYFCDRIEQLEFLENSIHNGRDTALISPRRMGKSGLISHLFASEKIKERYITIFIDIYATSTTGELVATLGNAIFKAMVKENDSAWRRFIDAVKSIRPSVTFDGNTGAPSIMLASAGIPNPQLTLEEIFEYLNNAPRPVIIAIDEFQEISKYPEGNAEALLRSLIQRTPGTRFIFAGSEQSVMSAMFSSARKPFYQSCILLHLPPIPEETYVEFAMNKFEEYGKKGNRDIFIKVYRDMQGITWFVQMIFNALFAQTPEGGSLPDDAYRAALQNIIGIQEYGYRELMARLSPQQRMLASFLAKAGPMENLLSAKTLEKSGFKTAASMQSAYRALQKAGIATKSECGYHLYDIFLAIWLKKQP